MRLVYGFTLVFLAACAGQPPAEAPIATRVVMAVPGAPGPGAAAPSAAAPGASTPGASTPGASTPATAEPDTHTVKVDTTNLVAVQRAGYKLVTKEGVPLYCRTDTQTGSRLVSHTTCLTEQELTAQMDATRQSMEHIGAHQTGPTGH